MVIVVVIIVVVLYYYCCCYYIAAEKPRVHDALAKEQRKVGLWWL